MTPTTLKTMFFCSHRGTIARLNRARLLQRSPCNSKVHDITFASLMMHINSDRVGPFEGYPHCARLVITSTQTFSTSKFHNLHSPFPSSLWQQIFGLVSSNVRIEMTSTT